MNNTNLSQNRNENELFHTGVIHDKLNRRNWLKAGLLGGLGLLAVGGGNSSCTCVKVCQPKPRLKDFWKRVGKIQASELLENITNAVKAQIAYSRLLTESKRANVLLGDDSGHEQLLKAEEFFNKRTEELRVAKTTLNRLAGSIHEEELKRANQLVKDQDFTKLKSDAREVAVRRFISGYGLTPEESEEAIQILDENLTALEDIRSFESIVQSLDQRLGNFINKKFGNPGLGRGLCILVLVLTSMYLVLIILAVMFFILICVLTLGFFCDEMNLQNILDDMIDSICGPE